MRVVIHPVLKERSVLEVLQSLAGASRDAFDHHRIDCYAVSPDVRERAFTDLYDSWFARLGLQAVLNSLFERFPLISTHVGRVVFSAAARRGEQAAELFGDSDRYTLAMRVHAATLARNASFQRWAEHELMHVEDILDPAFEYDRRRAPTGGNPAMANLVRERYAVLWALSIDVRIDARDPLPVEWWARRETELARAFSLDAGATRIFDECRASFLAARPTHGSLVERAESGDPLATAPRHTSVVPSGPRPGTNCPICGFSTFDWFDFDRDPDLALALHSTRPQWSRQLGLCRRCAEIHALPDPAPAAVLG